tara:strand:+ start:1524 stop:2777 length:1254 start_codon:yes stop_codon:yes gene_type:complete
MDPLAFNINSTYGVVIHRNFKPLYVDDKYAHIFGYESGQQIMELDSLFEIIDPNSHQSAQQVYDGIMSGAMQPGVRSYVNKDSTKRTFTVLTVEHVVEFEGEPALQITVIDMSTLDKANQRVRDNERQYRELIANSYQGIIVHRNFKPLMVNKAFVSMTKADSIQIVLSQSDFFQLIPETRRLQAQEKYRKLISGELKGFSSEVENECYDGVSRVFQLYENCIQWDGEPAVQSVMVDITEKYHLQQKLAFQAKHDDLTGALKRNAIYHYLDQLAKPLKSLSVLMIDIDDFKTINDQHGHLVGDQVILHVASLCQNIFGDTGAIGRWGGEEFIVLLPNTPLKDSIDLAENLILSMASYDFQTEGATFHVTLSAGLSHQTQMDFRKQVKEADTYLYKAKAQGKNQVIYADKGNLFGSLI